MLTQKTVQLNSLTMGSNPRLPSRLNIQSLAENIMAVGRMLEPPTVWDRNNDGTYEVIRGHRRTTAAIWIQENFPIRFGELFPDGKIIVLVQGGITAAESVLLKLDHTDQQGLESVHEVQMSADMLFDLGKTEAEVAFHLSSLIDRVAPMKAKAAKTASELRGKLADSGDSVNARIFAEKELKEFIFQYRRGYVQHLKNVWRSPVKVSAALFFKADGSKPYGFEGIDLPSNITNGEVAKLWKAHSADLDILDDNGVPKYNKEFTGPLFNAAWEKVMMDEAAEDNGTKETAKKSMSSKDIEAEIGVRWSSIGFVKLSQYHAGNKEVSGLAQLDKAYRMLDRIQSIGDGKLFAKVIEAGEKIEAAMAAKDTEAKGVEDKG